MAAAKEIKLVSSFARFVNADIKGGAAAHAYRREVIATAIEQAYKGNYSPITEAIPLSEGKTKKARAYAAGFAALGKIGDESGIIKVQYVGSLSSHDNKAARDAIAQRTASSMEQFFAAFDAVVAEKPAPKEAKGETKDTTPAPAPADATQHDAAVSLDSSVTSMEGIIRAGSLNSDQLDRIGKALVSALPVDLLRELAEACAVAETRALLAEQSGAPLASVQPEAAHA